MYERIGWDRVHELWVTNVRTMFGNRKFQFGTKKKLAEYLAIHNVEVHNSDTIAIMQNKVELNPPSPRSPFWEHAVNWAELDN
jgi:hypothetical protein